MRFECQDDSCQRSCGWGLLHGVARFVRASLLLHRTCSGNSAEPKFRTGSGWRHLERGPRGWLPLMALLRSLHVVVATRCRFRTSP